MMSERQADCDSGLNLPRTPVDLTVFKEQLASQRLSERRWPYYIEL